jgi:hypothetical protein
MATISDLFKSRVNEIYGKSEKIRIDTRGIINPPRGAALLTSAPDTLSSLLGNQVGGALGGSADRPTDTIFPRASGFFTKPISLLAPTQALLKDAVKEGTPYFIKHSPAPPSPKSILKSTDQTVSRVLLSTINKFGSANGLKKLKDSLKKSRTAENEYGAKFSKTSLDGKTYLDKKVAFSKYYEENEINATTLLPEFDVDTNRYTKKLQERTGNKLKSWDNVISEINEKTHFEDDTKLAESKRANKFQNQIWVTFKKYGNKEIIPLVASITGISEDVTPEWSNFKYLGSPFKVYRYQGVERSVKFNLKLYYNTIKERTAMMQKLNYLKSLAFPYEQISEMTYGDNKQTSQYAFSPQLFYFSVGDMYTNVLSHLESISINVEDNVSWPNFQPNGIDATNSADEILYPSVVDVAFSIKILEQNLHSVDSTTKTYKYNFDGRNTPAITSIKDEAPKPAQQTTAQLDALRGRGPQSFI